MAALGAVAVMLVAGWQFGVSGTEAPFSATEVALEKAIAGSGDSIICHSILQGTDGIGGLFTMFACNWDSSLVSLWRPMYSINTLPNRFISMQSV
jgi:hypothetical protein